MECPNCRLAKPPSAQRCDCGYDFQTQKAEQSYVRSAAGQDIVRSHLGLVPVLSVFGVGVAIASATSMDGEIGQRAGELAFTVFCAAIGAIYIGPVFWFSRATRRMALPTLVYGAAIAAGMVALWIMSTVVFLVVLRAGLVDCKAGCD